MTSRPENLGPHGFGDALAPFSENDEKEIEICKRWISTFISPRTTLNNQYSSYGMKHLVEDWAETYVSNGAFIAAAIDLGYRYKQGQAKSPNAVFNMSFAGYVAKWQKCPNCGKRVREFTLSKAGDTDFCPKCHAKLLWEKEGVLTVAKMPDF